MHSGKSKLMDPSSAWENSCAIHLLASLRSQMYSSFIVP